MIGQILQNYKVLSKIGEGGMGYVYLAEHMTLHRKAAIKFLNPIYAKDQEIKARFLNEGYTLGQLNHNNIVALYDFSEYQNSIYLVLEYVSGHPLDIFIEKINGPIAEQVAIRIFEQILEGFNYAHQKGVIHRDVKPSNIILTPDYTPKILDFGIAKMLTVKQNYTKAGDKVGTILYMSPEQVRGHEVDMRTDIYSLGVTLFEMLTGKKVYELDTMTDYVIQTKIINEPLPRASDYYPAISRHMENVIAKATEKDPNNRFQTCEEFISALSNLYFNQNAYSSPKNSFPEVNNFQNKSIPDYEEVAFEPEFTNDENHLEYIKEEYRIQKEEVGDIPYNKIKNNSVPQKSDKVISQRTEIYRAKPIESGRKKYDPVIIYSIIGGLVLVLVIIIIYINSGSGVIETPTQTTPIEEVKKIDSVKIEPKKEEDPVKTDYVPPKQNVTRKYNKSERNTTSEPPTTQKPRGKTSFE